MAAAAEVTSSSIRATRQQHTNKACLHRAAHAGAEADLAVDDLPVKNKHERPESGLTHLVSSRKWW